VTRHGGNPDLYPDPGFLDRIRTRDFNGHVLMKVLDGGAWLKE